MHFKNIISITIVILLFNTACSEIKKQETAVIEPPPLKPEVPECKSLYKKTDNVLKRIGFLDTISRTNSAHDTTNRIIGGLLFLPLAMLPGGGSPTGAPVNNSGRYSKLNDELFLLKKQSKVHDCNVETYIANHYEKLEKQRDFSEVIDEDFDD